MDAPLECGGESGAVLRSYHRSFFGSTSRVAVRDGGDDQFLRKNSNFFVVFFLSDFRFFEFFRVCDEFFLFFRFRLNSFTRYGSGAFFLFRSTRFVVGVSNREDVDAFFAFDYGCVFR